MESDKRTFEEKYQLTDKMSASDSGKYNMILEKWDDVLQYVKAEKNVPQVAYITWLMPLKPVKLLDGKLYVMVCLADMAEYVEKQYGFSIIRGIEELAGFTVQLQFVPENVCRVSLENI